MKKTHFFMYYFLIGITMLSLALINHEMAFNKILIVIFLLFFIIGALDQFQDLLHIERYRMGIRNINTILGVFSAAALTWYINHKIGFGPIVANGMVGVIVALSFSSKLSGILYAASFVGMSSQTIIPSALMAGMGGLLVGIILLHSNEVYAGIGGKGGTTAAISTQIVNLVLKLFL